MSAAGKLIIEGLERALVSAQCDHAFEYIRPFPQTEGHVGKCIRCKCRFTVFPGTVHYDEILAARKPA